MITVTEKAAARIQRILETNQVKGGLRIGLVGGGCSGLSYKFKLESTPRPDDHIFEVAEGVRVFVDPKSFAHLDGMTLDFQETVLQSDFVFHNPNAKSTCGCGKSFAS
ncbi:MAG TPA: iron-sulfur cluster assembly accessory protein [Terriglobia bacterium]|nr:iron-sulfur cluster assembly accessory protein [Terriglobia bacterium]